MRRQTAVALGDSPGIRKKVKHPAPFPVELPYRLIQLYTFTGDIVLDPFMGSGSTAIAALKSGRHYVGFEIDPAYLQLAGERIAAQDFNHSNTGDTETTEKNKQE